jgi:hypothetical protein
MACINYNQSKQYKLGKKIEYGISLYAEIFIKTISS